MGDMMRLGNVAIQIQIQIQIIYSCLKITVTVMYIRQMDTNLVYYTNTTYDQKKIQN